MLINVILDDDDDDEYQTLAYKRFFCKINEPCSLYCFTWLFLFTRRLNGISFLYVKIYFLVLPDLIVTRLDSLDDQSVYMFHKVERGDESHDFLDKNDSFQ